MAIEDEEEAGATALQEVCKNPGVEGVLKLAKTVKLPGQTGQAFYCVSPPFDGAATLRPFRHANGIRAANS